MNTNKRVAIIASGDLSHALTTDAPACHNPAGEQFDAKIQELLSSHNVTGLLGRNKQLVDNAAECGFRSLLILLGVLRDVNYEYRQYAYETVRHRLLNQSFCFLIYVCFGGHITTHAQRGLTGLIIACRRIWFFDSRADGVCTISQNINPGNGIITFTNHKITRAKK